MIYVSSLLIALLLGGMAAGLITTRHQIAALERTLCTAQLEVYRLKRFRAVEELAPFYAGGAPDWPCPLVAAIQARERDSINATLDRRSKGGR